MPKIHIYEIRRRIHHCGFDLISDALPFGRLWYGEPNAVANAIGYAKFTAVHMMLCFAFTIRQAT
jgi:hypothetical protein